MSERASGLRDRLRLGRGDLLDAAFATVLAVLGVIGFRTSFAGGEELIVGVPAVLIGAATGYALVKLRVPLLAATGLAAVVFFALGGPLALRHRALAGVLPTAAAVSGLADGVVNGWVRLLTTLPPAGEAGDLLAIPYLCGFVGGTLAVALALRFPRRFFCVLPPAAVLVVSVLMGTKRPASLLLQGVVFAALTIAWVSVRHHRARAVTQVAVSRSRLVTAGGLLLVSAVSGVFVGPRLPGGADPDQRYVLREDIEPPFDPLTEPSPLAAYRNYTDQDVREDRILTVRGLPEGARVRIAAMDAYSGTEWEATGDGSVVGGEYLRVGASLPSDDLGAESTVTVEVHKPAGVWVPLAGDVTRLEFLGDRAVDLNDEVRVSIETDTAAVPGELRAGDRYRFTAEFVDLPAEAELREAPLDSRFRHVEAQEVPTEFVSRGAEWAADQPTPFAEMAAIADGLRTDGAYTDGGEDANPVSPPGHSLRRLLDFIALEQPFGNGEQFAAAQGLLAQSRGVPVRVVMGFVNEGDDEEVTFRGEDIEAWIEIPVAGYGWVAVDGTPPEDQLPDPLKRPRSKTENPEPQPPPPTTVPPSTSIPDDLQPEEPEEEEEEMSTDGLPGWLRVAMIVVGVPGLLLGAPAGLIVVAKRRRRTRRRTRGSAAQRVAGSFIELVDYARDAGGAVPARATRRELATVVAASGATRAKSLAVRADTAVFGPDEPTDADVDAAWEMFLEARAEMVAGMDRRARARASLNPTSLRPPR
jgi:hypothetical protein